MIRIVRVHRSIGKILVNLAAKIFLAMGSIAAALLIAAYAFGFINFLIFSYQFLTAVD